MHIVPGSDRVVIVLGDTPRRVVAFNVYRRGPADRELLLLNPRPIRSVDDPLVAAELMGEDFRWIARRLGTEDPEAVWRKLRTDSNTALTLCLISHGLRKALGRTLIDMDVERGERYRYRVELLDMYDRRIDSVEERVTVTGPDTPPKPTKVRTEAGDGSVLLSWEYPAYRGRENDLTVGFHIYRSEEGAEAARITAAPALRVEGWLSYVDEGVENGKTYRYEVQAVDLVGARSERVPSEPVRPEDRSAPLIPKGLTAVDQEQGVLVIWRLSPDLDAAYYNLYRSDSLEEAFEPLEQGIPLDQPRFVDRNIQRGKAYFYQVTAVDKAGNESKPGGPASIIPADSEPPPGVEGFAFTLKEDQRILTLKWQPLELPDLQGYFIYRGSSRTELLRIVSTPLEPDKSPSYVDSGYREQGLRPGKNLVYAVSAVDFSFNEGPKSYREVQVPDNVAPPPPFSLSGRSTAEGQVRLDWQPCLSRDLALHRIYRQQKRSFSVVAELGKEHTTWIDRDVERGGSYRYRITEVDGSGNESEPSREVEVVAVDSNPPEPPPAVSAIHSRRGVEIAWQPSPAEDVIGYRVYRAAYRGDSWQQIGGKLITETQLVDRRGEARFVYAVSAVDSSGNEGPKTEGSAAEETEP